MPYLITNISVHSHVQSSCKHLKIGQHKIIHESNLSHRKYNFMSGTEENGIHQTSQTFIDLVLNWAKCIVSKLYVLMHLVGEAENEIGNSSSSPEMKIGDTRPVIYYCYSEGWEKRLHSLDQSQVFNALRKQVIKKKCTKRSSRKTLTAAEPS